MWTCSTVSRRKVIEYRAKYATKSEPRSQPLKELFTTIVRSLKEDDSSLKAVQKLLINSVGERDFSAQETCHLLLQLPMFKASRDFVILNLDGSRAVEERLEEDQPATVPSALDHYVHRPTTGNFENTTLLHFVQHYSMPRVSGSEPSIRRKKVVVIVRPYCPPDPEGPKYEQYCQQKLMLHVPFQHQRELLGNHTTFNAAFAEFLQSGSIPPSLEDDIHRLQQSSQQPPEDDTEVSISIKSYYTCNKKLCNTPHFRNQVISSPASNPPELLRSGCSSARATQTCSQALSLKMRTGQQQHKHTPTLQRCPPSSLGIVSQQVSRSALVYHLR